MVNPEPFELPKEQIINKLTKENNWYNKKYGPYIDKRGLDNWKNLFRRPNLLEWTIFIMLLLALFMGWAYTRDFKVYEQNIQQNCCEICSSQLNFAESIPENPMLYFNEETMKESGEG